jgi:hypothetical protein
MNIENKYQNIPILLVFALFYNVITLFFVNNINPDESSSLGYLFIFPIFWIIAGISIAIYIRTDKIKITNYLEKIVLGFSTPLPFFIFLIIWHSISPTSHINSSSEYEKNGLKYKKIEYTYSNLKLERKEYYISNGYDWVKDSIWEFYSKDGAIIKKENYMKNKYRK